MKPEPERKSDGQVQRVQIARTALCLIVVFSVAGCGYNVGPTYDPQIRTVHVPMFTNGTFRRGVEFQLTEAVQNEIKKQTPLQLTSNNNADTRLTGRIIEIRKDVLGETNNDDPRELQLSLAVEMKWEDLRTGQLITEQRFPIPNAAVPLTATGDFAPELGHSLATAEQRAIDDLARQVVEMMEMPW